MTIQRSRPLTPWELPKLLEPMHRWHRSRKLSSRERPHFVAILAFIYRNRYAVSSQIQRRFAAVLPSDRTARRHLAEMESLGYLAVAEARCTSPLWPKIYFVTGQGARRLRETLRQRREPGTITRVDRRRRHGVLAEHLLHEVLITEFLLEVRCTVQRRDDLELLTVQRRSLERHQAFGMSNDGQSRLKPDGMFLYRQQGKGMLCCFVELDNGTMGYKQLRAKFRSYGAWALSALGQTYLCDLYRRHGAQNPQPTFRVLIVARDRYGVDDEGRMQRLRAAAAAVERTKRSSFWLTTIHGLCGQRGPDMTLEAPIWRRGDDSQAAWALF